MTNVCRVLVLAPFLVACAVPPSTEGIDTTKSTSSATSPSPDGGNASCGAVTAAGSCNGNVMQWCTSDDHTLQLEDCSLEGAVCVQDANGAYCDHTGDGITDGGTSSGCGSVTTQGSCNGQVAQVCVNSTLQSTDCSAQGYACIVDGSGAHCDDSSTTPTDGGQTGGACGTITVDGICDSDTLEYCDGTEVQTVDCSQNGGCVVDNTGFASCAD